MLFGVRNENEELWGVKAEDHMSKFIGQCGLTKRLAPRQLDEVIQP